jgi:hypothetical protein
MNKIFRKYLRDEFIKEMKKTLPYFTLDPDVIVPQGTAIASNCGEYGKGCFGIKGC